MWSKKDANCITIPPWLENNFQSDEWRGEWNNLLMVEIRPFQGKFGPFLLREYSALLRMTEATEERGKGEREEEKGGNPSSEN